MTLFFGYLRATVSSATVNTIVREGRRHPPVIARPIF